MALGTAEFGMVKSVLVSVFLAHGSGSRPGHQPLLLRQAQCVMCSQATVLVLGVKIVPPACTCTFGGVPSPGARTL